MKKIIPIILLALLISGIYLSALAAVEDTGFFDVDANAWYAEAVMYCREHNPMAGIGSSQFAPESSLSWASAQPPQEETAIRITIGELELDGVLAAWPGSLSPNCPSNNTAAIFYSQSSNPNLAMRIYPIGKVIEIEA